MKTKSIFKNKFKYYLKGVGYTYLLTLAVMFVLPVVFALLFTGSLRGVSIHNLLKNNLLPFISILFLLISSYRVYKPFKFYIQNGISRRTVWKATIGVVGLCSLLMSLINYGYYYAIVVPVTGIVNNTFYSQLFGQFLGFHNFWNGPAQIVYEWLLLWSFAVIAMFFGSLSALFKKRTRLIIWLTIFIGVVVIIRFLMQFHTGMNLDWMESVVKFVAGYTKTDGEGMWNPFHPIGTMAVGIIIGTGINYWIQQKIVLKNQ
ncbi:hypothetical protein SIN07_03190 [Pediococcus inopinatus]|uniref:ABC transporter permease n=1 Tax=Pediococcus inopinatus TaxID=114090 RepID=A0ABZ0Q2L0_9LACO|nr:hypothetical protein [Pediococcus inopinatus]AVL00290.1 hypothetical protein PI20285_06405 [Pediococcus inopinatus]KRN63390.1 hypothetical protein IV83_GL001097 [Pediococcus inopinatus]WPC17951.1 hypothetical protein N6G94_02785 [Pediococcus inopinatus]WPC19501.1 hypothetical protein N6G95_09825 [Pediococcus inopinatus]WPC21201.1 hypothetical protein N6G96_07925 [Pediococcus inopinatus]